MIDASPVSRALWAPPVAVLTLLAEGVVARVVLWLEVLRTGAAQTREPARAGAAA